MRNRRMSVPAIWAIANCGGDAIEFALKPEVFPQFYTWLQTLPGISPAVSAEQVREDMGTILTAIRQSQTGVRR